MTAGPTYSGPTPVVRPIQFVTDVPAWRAFYEDVGFVGTGVDADGWTVLAAGSGRLALHHADAGSPLAGKTKLGLEVSDLESYRAAVAASDVDVRPVTLAHGDALAVDLPQGRLHIDPAGPGGGLEPVAPETLAVLALVYTGAVLDGARAAARLGLRRRIESDSGGWADLVAHGVLAFHDGPDERVDETEIGTSISLEIGDVEALQARLEAAGRTARVIDESYSRTLRIEQPDGQELWVNETQRDLYGYHLAETGEQAR